jgi:polyisoprenyl-teichoic acid--peptidoglycan teichoic acid transferase
MNTGNRKRKRKRRKIRFFRVFMVLFLFVLIIFSSTVFYQYHSGAEEAERPTDPRPEVSEFNGEKNEQGKVNVLLLGVDSRGEEASRTDTIMIAQYDPENEEAKIVSLMRDIYVDIPDHGSWKLNTSYFLGGPELLRQTLKESFGIDVQYYALVDFKGFQKVVDVVAPEGVMMDVEKRMSENIDVVLEPGFQKLDGEELLNYARFRHDAEGDFGRVERQQKVINALKEELLSLNGLTKIPRAVGTVSPYVETNMDNMDILGLAKEFVLNPVTNIDMLRVPVDGSYTNERYEQAGAVLEIDFEQNREAIRAFLNGEKLPSADPYENEEEVQTVQ